MYKNGEGVPQDYLKAYAWINLAVIDRDTDYIVKLQDDLREMMSPSQISEAQKLSSELFNRIESHT